MCTDIRTIREIAARVLRFENDAAIDPAKCLADEYGMESLDQMDFVFQLADAFEIDSELLDEALTAGFRERQEPFSVNNIAEKIAARLAASRDRPLAAG